MIFVIFIIQLNCIIASDYQLNQRRKKNIILYDDFEWKIPRARYMQLILLNVLDNISWLQEKVICYFNEQYEDHSALNVFVLYHQRSSNYAITK